MVPIHRYLPAFIWLKNANVYDKEFGAEYVPKNAEDFKRVLQTLTRPQQDFYGMSGAQQTIMWLPQFAALFGAPNDWRLEPGGKVTKDWETPEYKEAAGYVRDLFASGVFHPNSTTFASGVVARAQFAASKFGIWLDPVNGWQDAWRQALQSSQPFEVHMIPPFAAHDGGKVQHFITGGHLWATAVKKGSPERVKELLRIMNWLAAPFGSAEDQLLTFGVNGADYTLDSKGNPTLTPQGNTDANYVPWKYTIQHPFVFFTPDLPTYAKTMTEAEKQLIPVAVFWGTGSLFAGIAPAPLPRFAILVAVNAYAVSRIIMAVGGMLVSPTIGRLRLLEIGDDEALYLIRWLRRITTVAVAGAALASLALLFGLNPGAHDTLIRIVGLIVAVLLGILVLRGRHRVALRLRAPPGAEDRARGVASRSALARKSLCRMSSPACSSCSKTRSRSAIG
jgi:hypothetical protein